MTRDLRPALGSDRFSLPDWPCLHFEIFPVREFSRVPVLRPLPQLPIAAQMQATHRPTSPPPPMMVKTLPIDLFHLRPLDAPNASRVLDLQSFADAASSARSGSVSSVAPRQADYLPFRSPRWPDASLGSPHLATGERQGHGEEAGGSLARSPGGRTWAESPPGPQEEPPPANTWVVDFWPPELGEKKVQWFHDPPLQPRTPGWWFLVTAAAAGKEHSLGALPQVCVQGSQRGKVSPHPEWRGHHSQKSLVLAAVVLFKPLLISLRDGPGPRWNPTSVSLHFSSPSPLWAAQQSTASWAAENIRNLFFSKFWRPEVHDQPVGSVYLPHPPTPSRAPLAAGTCSAHVSQPAIR
ncbi:uncharacterized protein LOC119864773 isoform X3 [Canis lupus familiaris]|uniref:uncharacterized protein LOC119864773 isoform X3 n=1 Tax=Canis lupus familiaris TaxID=9615 RepID=UPI0018F32F4B|nr:uncharacterized protein LOC119864773 isoform X3 [Canis lupus familiaris]XP_038423596.1 uncharacterized protein LOC119864773 isoform X3 [Canis lupus familiaris]